MSEQRRPSQCALMLERLSDGRRHSTVELNALGVGRPNSRSSDLEHRHGYRIVCEYVAGAEGAHAYQYRLLEAPAVSLHGLEEQLSPDARSRLERFQVSPAQTPPAAVPRDPENAAAAAEEPGGCQELGRLDAQGGPANRGPDSQLSLDELAGIENELNAIQSLGELSPEDVERFDLLTARHDELDRSAA